MLETTFSFLGSSPTHHVSLSSGSPRTEQQWDQWSEASALTLCSGPFLWDGPKPASVALQPPHPHQEPGDSPLSTQSTWHLLLGH